MYFKFYANKNYRLLSLKKCLVLFLIAILPAGYSFSQTAATALSFDGVNDYVNVPVNPSLNISSALTIETWIYPTKIGGVQNVISKSSSVQNNGYIFPRTSSGWGTVEFLLNFSGYINPSGNSWVTLAVNYGFAKVNQWHHLAATYDGYYMRIYIDGILSGSQQFSGNINVNNNPLTIGAQPGFNDEYFQGKVDEVRIWKRALTQCEIANNMNCELGGAQTGLAAYYKLNQGLVNSPNLGLTVATDESGNNANGVLANFDLTGSVSNWTDGKATGTCSVFIPVIATAGSVDANVPVGGTINLTSGGGDTYSWIGPNGFTSTLQNPSITGVGENASGIYTVIVTKNGCSVAASTKVTVAQRAGALQFNGANNYITIPNGSSFNNTTALSIETWINPATGSTSLVQNVLSKSTSIESNGYIFPRTDDGWRSFSFWLSVNGTWKVITAPFPALNQWNHVAATYDGFYLRIFLNGALAGSLEAPGTITTNTNNVTIGQQPGTSLEYFKGGLDEMRIWNRALTQCEIQNNLTCELNGQVNLTNNGLASQTGLAAYYRFNQGLVEANNAAFTTLADSSGKANNGTLYNFDLSGTASNWIAGKANGTCGKFVGTQATAGSNGPVLEVGSTIQLTASNGTSWLWTGPAGFTSNLQNPTIPNAGTAQSGNYTVSVTGSGCSINASTKVTIAYRAGTLHFDGVNDQVTVPASPSLNIPNTITLESWIYPTNGITVQQDVMCKSTKEVNNGYIFPRTDDAWQSFVFYLHINGEWQKLSSPYLATGTISLNEWHHLAATYDGFYMRIYMDGVLKESKQVYGKITQNNNDLLLGQQPGFLENFGGKIDEARIWNRALNQCEIINNMDCELDPSVKNGLVAYYKFNQGFLGAENPTITTLNDASDNGNNGTLQNFALQGNSSNWSAFKINKTCQVFSLPPVTLTTNGSLFGVGSTIKFFATGGSTYNWDGPNSFVSNQQNPIINNAQIAASGIYTVTVPFVNCVVAKSTRLIVSPLSPIAASGPTTFCPSGSVTLSTSNAGNTYQWYLNDVAIAGANAKSYVARITGSYSVIVDNGADILVAVPVTVTVVDNLAPVPVVAQLPTLTIATPTTITTFPTAIDDCKGTITGVANIPLTFKAGSEGVYTITWSYDDGNGHVVTQDQQVIVIKGVDITPPVLSLPASITVNGITSLCGATVNFTATATDDSGDPVTITYSQDPLTVFAVGITTVTVTATDASMNKATGSFTVTVLPTVVAPITGNTTICAGATTILATTSTGGTWSTNNNAVATVSASGVVTGVSAGTAIITYTNNCGATATVTVTINAIPSAPAVVVTNNCGTSTLTTDAVGSLAWNTNPVSTATSITVSTAGTYSVTRTVDGCTSAAGSGTASPKAIPSAPAVTVTNNCGTSTLSTDAVGSLAWNTNPVSTGTSITVSSAGTYSVTRTVDGCTSAAGSGIASPKAIPSAPVVTVTNNCGTSPLSTDAGGSLVWNTNPVSTGTSITVSTAGTYSVTRTVDGCTSEAGSGTASPKAIPSAPVVTVTNNCGTSTLTTDAVGSLAWNTNPVSTGTSITVSTAGIYSVTRTIDGCTSAAGSGTVSPKTIPSAPVVTITNNCGTSTLTTDAVGSLIWNTNPVSTATSITVSTAGTYGVTRTVDGCTSAAGSGTASPKAIPSAPVVTVKDNCGSSTLSATTTGTLLWSTGATTSSINVSAAGTYSVTQTVGGCVSAAGSGTASPKAIPSVPFVTVVNNCGSSVLSTDATGILVWSNNASTSSITVNNSGNYSVTVTNVNGCSATSATTAVTINALPTVAAITGNNNVTIGSTIQLANATAGGVWSSNSAAATVNASGLVTGVSGGTATIGYKVTNPATGCATTVTTNVTVSACGTLTTSVTSIPTNSTYTGGVATNLYLGYGAQSTKLQVSVAAGGASSYTYSWQGSDINMLSSTTSSNPVFTPTKGGSYLFTVTATNNSGCSGTGFISICVTDIRVFSQNGNHDDAKKVYLCHVPPGNSGKTNTLSISVDAVAAHLSNHPGDRLGSCDQKPCSAQLTGSVISVSQTITKEAATLPIVSNREEGVKVTVLPNPSTTYFTLKFESKDETPLTLRVMDANGRVIDAKSKIGANSTLQIGHNYISGIYYAEIIQGAKRQVVQLMKVRS